MARILLLDGNSLLYRGFFAMRVLTTSTGIPTNAIYSMTLMLSAALDREKPDAAVCAWDHRDGSFRDVAFADYKGTRLSMPDEMKPQRQLARDLMRAFNIPMLEIPGFEADDTIGTLAERGKSEGHEVLIVTGDLDALQLVDDDPGPVQVMTTIKGVSETIIYDEKAVQERYDLSPEQIPDYKALKGDTSDNIPGVPGIGDKTARQLLTEYGTIENLLDHREQVASAKTKALLEQYAEQARQCKMLATIRRDVPLGDFTFTLDYQANGLDREAVKTLFDKLEFRTLAKRVLAGNPPGFQTADAALTPGPSSSLAHSSPRRGGKDSGAGKDSGVASSAPPSYPPLPNEERMVKGEGRGVRASESSILFELDTPLDKSDFLTATLKAIAVSRGEDVQVVMPDAMTPEIRAFLEDAGAPKIVHDAKLALGLLARHGITLRGVVFDTMLAAYLINAGRGSYKLSDLVQDYLGLSPEEGPEALAAALRDVQPILAVRLDELGLRSLLDTMELPLAGILAQIERTGVAINASWLKIVSHDLDGRIKTLESEIHALAGEKFAIGSTKQLQVVLFEKMALPSGKKTKTGYSTDSEVMENLAAKGHEIGSKILQWRELSKLKSTYADAIPLLVSPEDGRVHTSLNQTVTATGRLSSSNPNLQNIPIRSEIGREIRKGFTAEDGCVLVSADYSQIELRIFAHITKDPELIRTFAEDEDIHRRTAALVFDTQENLITSEQRRRAKTINFAVIYGMSDFRLAAELDTDVATASDWKKRYFSKYPGVQAYAEQILTEARARGYVQTLLGRRRYTPDINSRVFQFRQTAEREAVNMPVQGTSADIMKLAMIHVDQALRDQGLRAKMTLQVHDELVFECPPDEVAALAGLVRSEMENAYKLDVHLKAEVRRGENWAEMTTIS